MEFIVTARKWRPKRFDEIIGQEHITNTLKNAIRLNRISHAYLFSGPRGIGKTTTARILARAVNCQNLQDAEPCNQCDSCLSILNGTSLDVIEIDGASNNSVDDVRSLRENAKYPPSLGKYKLYIIDEVHMLSTSAFNALLKILEEPPKHLIFIFATTEPHKVLPTILSRCQRYEFRRMDIPTIVKQIQKIAKAENISIDEESLFVIAKKADGSMRDAQSIFDQFAISCEGKITFSTIKDFFHLIDDEYFFKVSESIIERKLSNAFEISNEITKNGYDYFEFLDGLVEHFRNILAIKLAHEKSDIFLPQNLMQKLHEISTKFSEHDLIRIINLIIQTQQQLKYSISPKIRVELLLTQLIEMPNTIQISELIKEIHDLKKNYNKIAPEPKTKKQLIEPQQQHYSTQANIIPPSTQETYTKTASPTSQTQSSEPAQPKTIEEFFENYKDTINGLQLLAQHQTLRTEIRDKRILFIVNNRFYYDFIQEKRYALIQAIKEFFGTGYTLEILLAEENNSSVANTQGNDQRTNFQQITETTSSEQPRTELEKKIIELFNARQIPL